MYFSAHFQESTRRNSSPVLEKKNTFLSYGDIPVVAVDDSVVPLLKKKGSPNISRRLLGLMQVPKGEQKSQDKKLSPRLARRLLGKKRPILQPLHEDQSTDHSRELHDQIVDPKAMSMPHGTTSSNDQNDKWLYDYRRVAFPEKVDWTVQAFNGCHVWQETDTSGCFSSDCKKSGPRKRCSVCKVVAHHKCIEQLERNQQIKCRPTYREATRELEVAENNPHHHCVRRRRQEGKCETCGKSFQSMLSYKSTKDFIAISCSWCKRAFHLKSECSTAFLKESHCDLGFHKNLILPPSWVVKLPPRKYSQVSGKRGRSFKRLSSKERRAFVIKPIENDFKIPLIIFVNPRSGGNQGAKILEKYQYILNPRQVFDLSNGGPRFALDLYRKVPNLRILVCGGDGTAGWILSEIDRLKINPPPAVSILPLGTGNDLARFLGWGGGYMDEPLSKILAHVEEGEVQKLDRWDIDVRPNTNAPTEEETNTIKDNSVSKLPLNVMNNYFSVGADADVCLEFHESREANPEKFNSRIKNLYFYGRKGGETVIKRKSKDLYKCIDNLLCDGCDLTEKIRELKPVCLIFLNISSYSAGTSPWGNPNSEEFLPQSCDDGYLEIIGLTSKSMVATQVGGHGIRIFQCQSAILTTSTKISMQVDGEPCRLNPSRIQLKIRNQANMIAKKKPHRSFYPQSQSSESLELITPKTLCTKLYYLTFQQYDSLVRFDIEEIKSIVAELCPIDVDPEWQLGELRKRLESMRNTEEEFSSKLNQDWCFLDATWKARIYRIDEAQEVLLHVSDILEGGIYVLDCLRKRDSITPSVNNGGSLSQPNSPLVRRSNGVETNNVIGNNISNSDNKLQQSWQSLDLPITRSSDDSSSELVTTSEEDDNISLSSSPTGTSSPPSVDGLDNDLDFVLPEDPVERTKALLDAAKRGYLNRFQILHDVGVKLTVCDSAGRAPLHIAARFGQKAIVEYIVNKVPLSVLDMMDTENGQTALHIAALHKKRTICRTLVAKGASIFKADLEGNTPQLLARKALDDELAKYLENQERLQLIAADDHETAV